MSFIFVFALLVNFDHLQVAEALPVPDESMDIVVGTLVLCSVKDVNLALKGTVANQHFLHYNHCLHRPQMLYIQCK